MQSEQKAGVSTSRAKCVSSTRGWSCASPRLQPRWTAAAATQGRTIALTTPRDDNNNDNSTSNCSSSTTTAASGARLCDSTASVTNHGHSHRGSRWRRAAAGAWRRCVRCGAAVRRDPDACAAVVAASAVRTAREPAAWSRQRAWAWAWRGCKAWRVQQRRHKHHQRWGNRCR